MQILSFFKKKIFNKKGRALWLLPFFMFEISCVDSNLSQYGKVTPQSTSNRNSFVFSVSEDYLADNGDSKKDKKYPKMTEAEAKLLIKILKQQKYCYNKDSKLAFKITSRQEKIYDMTFSHLIEQNYRARPITPRMYYGECVQ